MKYRAKSLARQRGLTLIEVLVSLLIFSIGFLGLIAMQARAIQISSDAQDRSRAALLANEIVSKMWMQKSPVLSDDDRMNWINRVRNAGRHGLPNSKGTISAPDGSGGVTVSITWHAPGRKNEALPDNLFTTYVVIQ